jgi:glycosyltransferase involved in cell wall biosynthesis
MDVTVIVCTYNRSRLLEGNLDALRRQEVAPDLKWEVVVVDNNCTDDTGAVVAAAGAGFPTELRRVSETRQGLSNARNRGISEARGTYVLFTDDDTRPTPDWVQRTWETFRASGADVIGGKVDILWPVARPSWFADELVSSLAGVDYGPLEVELTSERPPLGANMAFTRRVFEVVGGFDPQLGRIGAKLIGGEETDLFRRAGEAGMRGVYQPGAVVRHLVEVERLRKAYFRKLYFFGGQTSSRSYSPPAAKRILRVPVFVFRQLAHKIAASVRSRMAGRSDEAFMKQLQAVWLIGFILGCATGQAKPERATTGIAS